MTTIACERCGEECPSTVGLVFHLRHVHGMRSPGAENEANATRDRNRVESYAAVKAERDALKERVKELAGACEALLNHVRECNTQNPDWLALDECPPGHPLECGRCHDVRQARAALAKGASE